MSVIIHIPAKIIPEDHRIFVLHAGGRPTRKFLPDFVSNSRVYLDLPGVVLRPGFDKKNDHELLLSLQRARQISDWHYEYGDGRTLPPMDLDYYADQAAGVRTTNLYRSLDGLYKTAQKDDLVIVPNVYSEPVHIGEFTENYGETKVPTIASPRVYFGKFAIPSRQVKWLSSDTPKRELSGELIETLHRATALTTIGRYTDTRDEIYSLAYPDYVDLVNDGVGRITLSNSKVDLRDLGESSELIYYFAAMYFASVAGEAEHFASLDIKAAIERYGSHDQFELQVEIHSPGILKLISSEVLLAAYVTTMLSLSGCDAVDDDVKNPTFQSASDGGYETTGVLSSRIKEGLKLMHADRLSELRAKSKLSQEKTGMGSATTVEVVP